MEDSWLWSWVVMLGNADYCQGQVVVVGCPVGISEWALTQTWVGHLEIKTVFSAWTTCVRSAWVSAPLVRKMDILPRSG